MPVPPLRAHAALALAAALACGGPVAAAAPPAPSSVAMTTALRVPPEAIARLGWLAGCWTDGDTTRRTDEVWMAPLGGTMPGMSRTVRDGRTVGWEQTRIEARDSTLLFIARPSGQTEAAFALVELGDSVAVFADPAHDFPQRVSYRLRHDGSVLGRIEGHRGGADRTIDFPMARVPCSGAAAR